MSPDVRFRLEDMRDHAQKALRTLEALDVKDGRSVETPTFALLHLVQIVGEAASRVSAEVRRDLPELPWADAIAMRNIIVHGYRQVRLDIVVDTVRNDFPPLITALDRLLAEGTSE